MPKNPKLMFQICQKLRAFWGEVAAAEPVEELVAIWC
jgi:hypothetical protein